VLDTDLITTSIGIRRLASAIHIAVSARPLSIPVLAQFARALASAAGPSNLLSTLKQTVLDVLWRSAVGHNPFPRNASSFAFLFQALKFNFVIQFTKAFFPELTMPHIGWWLLAYFAPEFEAADREFLSDFVSRLRSDRAICPPPSNPSKINPIGIVVKSGSLL
jgi:hypothetical protein